MKSIFLTLSLVLAMLTNSMGQNLTADDVFVTLRLVDKDDIPEKFAKIEIEEISSKKIYTCTTDSFGECEIILPQGATYHTGGYIYGKPFDFPNVLELPDVDGPLNFDYNLKIIDNNFYHELYNDKYTLEEIYFETDKANFTKESFKELDNLYTVLIENPKMEIEIAGHTDNVGEEDYNLELSYQRANSVMKYLIEKGIDKSRLAAKGYGEVQPIEDNKTEAGRKKNRRTEIRIIRQ